MPSPKPGSTADLPPEEAIAAGEASVQEDIDAMFGMSSDDEETGVAAGSGDATSPDAAAGAAGAGTVDGQPPAPAKPSTEGTPSEPPSGDAVPPQPATSGDGVSTPPPGQQPAQAGQPPAPGAATPPAAPSDEALRVASLEATVQALQQALSNAQAQPAGQGQPVAGQPQPGQQDDLPRYALQLPPAVAAAINSGDDQQTLAGITHMMNSLATIIHHNVRQEYRASLAQLMQTARAQEEEGTTQRVIEDSRADYYKAFPDHNNPLILPIIQAESVAMAGQFPGLPWNENYRNALGQRVNARLAELRGQQQPSNVPPAPAAMLPAGSRPADSTGAELTGGDLIADTFS